MSIWAIGDIGGLA